jgi:HK97 family phage major capsid protein
MNSGNAPLLLDHMRQQQIGVIEKASVKSGRGVAVARLSKGPLASEVWADIQDGIRKNTSVGYKVGKLKTIEIDNETAKETFRAVKWKPLEASIVSIPADPSVGVGREVADGMTFIVPVEGERQMPDNQNPHQPPAAAQPAPASAVDEAAIRDAAAKEARKGEMARITGIHSVASRAHVDKAIVDKAIADGVSPEQFARAILEDPKVFPALKLPTQSRDEMPDPRIGLSDKEIRNYRLTRAIMAMDPRAPQSREAAAFELECSRAAEQRLGVTAKGLLVPYEILRQEFDIPRKRDLSAGSGEGPELVATNLLVGSFIDLLRNQMVLGRAGARMLSGLVGNVDIPRQTGTVTAEMVAEADDATAGDLTLDQVQLTPKNVSARTGFTRNLLLQSSMDVEALVRSDLAATIALKLDHQCLYGAGSGQEFTGLHEINGIGTVIFAATAPTWAEIVQMESTVGDANAELGALAYIMKPSFRGTLKTTSKDDGSGQFIWDARDAASPVNGYPGQVSNQIDANQIWFGNWSDALIGLWGGLDITVDPYTTAHTGVTRVIAFQSADFAVRHPVSFVVGGSASYY